MGCTTWAAIAARPRASGGSCPPTRPFLSRSCAWAGDATILVWGEEEDDFNVDEEDERMPRERWDERLVLGSGWLYKQDL
jgi:hypothetical protein